MRTAPRTLALVLLAALVACGGNKKAKDDAAIGPVADAALDAPPACANPVSGSTISARLIGQVPGGAMLATSPPGDARLFVIDQSGLIRIFDNEQLLPTPFLDISNDLVAGGEQGLLGLAFHPKYATNGTFFVDYTTSNKDIVAKCTVSADPNKANAGCTPILSISDPFSNHNAGMIEFGNDGYLYISTGDGGSGGDPNRNAQALMNGQITAQSNALLGKILRIDVDHPANGNAYGIPADNPFVAGGGLPEIWMYGLRNPWRWSFDRANGDMWIGDVGQGVTEEIDVLKAGQQAGKNLGWSVYEGASCCKTQGDKCTQSGTQADCALPDMVMPLDMRTHTNGWLAIIGGQVYRGSCYPDMIGWYFYSDNQHGHLAKARLNAGGTLDVVDLPGTFPNQPASLHADARGELYLTTSSTPGRIYHIEAGP